LIVQLLFWMDSRIYFTTVPLGEIGWYPWGFLMHTPKKRNYCAVIVHSNKKPQLQVRKLGC